MTSSKTYTAMYHYDADENAWNVRIKGLDGWQTYGRSIRQAQSRISEALALWLDAHRSRAQPTRRGRTSWVVPPASPPTPRSELTRHWDLP